MALRFVPYSESNGHLNAGWAAVMGALLLVGARRLASTSSTCSRSSSCGGCARGSCAREDPDTSEHEIDARFEEDLETGEFPALR